MDIKQVLKENANPEQAKALQRFFKTGKGEYGEGDIFLGIKVPEQRKIAEQFLHLSSTELQKLLSSRIHEERLVSLLILINKYNLSDEKGKETIFNLYLSNTKNINNWDLVDLSAPKIVGEFLKNKDKSILYKLAKSQNLWEKRISIISTYAFIKEGKFEDTIKISEILLNDSHDLIQKAVGWMLREIGKRDIILLKSFLNKYSSKMPRTMLRYAIEKLPEKERKLYLSHKSY
ncbi:MAG: DNA alkylation repair protein [Candidatus Pacearchaeota archaeon]